MKSLLICICIVCGLFLFAANSASNTTDSLFAVVKKSRGKDKVDALNILAKQYMSSSADSVLLYSRSALEIAEKSNYDEGKCQALKLIGVSYLFMADTDSSIFFALKSLEIAEAINDLKSQADNLLNIGTAYIYEQRLDDALEYYYKALKIDSLRNDKEEIGSTLMNIGTIELEKNNYGETIEIFLKALDIAKQFNDYKNLSNVYHNLGIVYHRISDYEKSIYYFLKALTLEEQNDDEVGQAYTYNNIGIVFKEWDNYKKALEYFNKSLKIAKKTGLKIMILHARLNIGSVYGMLHKYEQEIEQYNLIDDLNPENIDKSILSSVYLNKGISFKNLLQYDSAAFYYQKALEIREEIDDKEQLARVYYFLGDLMYVMHRYDKATDLLNTSNTYTADYRTRAENYDLLSKIYERKNDKDKALEYFKKSVAMHDSVFSEEKYKQINELQIQYETEKKEQQIESLEKINEAKAKQLKLTRLIFGLAIAAVLVVILSGAMFFHNRQLRSKHRMLLTEQKLLRSQMNPHFIFNSLSAIQSYILKNKALEAGSYLSRFAKLMRSILDNSSKEFITLEEEIETLNNYLNLQKIRLQEKLGYSIRADDGLLEEEISVPPMLSQPFIENSIEHGILKKESAEGKIDIHFIDKQDQIIIEIIDNGIGREKAGRLGEKKHRSRATEIIQSRIALLSKAYKIKPTFETIDLYDKNNKPEGTKVLISLPKLFL